MQTDKVTVSVDLSFLTQRDVDELKDCGYTNPADLLRIDFAAKECSYKEYNVAKYGDYKGHCISREDALELLGREDFLSGISYAALDVFHHSYIPYTTHEDGVTPSVLFDCSRI